MSGVQIPPPLPFFNFINLFNNIKYNHYNFNKIYHQNLMSYSYLPAFNLKNIKAKDLIDEIKKRIKNK